MVSEVGYASRNVWRPKSPTDNTVEAPGGLDFHSSDLSHTWKRWSKRIQLYITIQQMDLIQVRFGNILSLVASSHKEHLTKEKLVDQFPVFQGTGKLSERYHLQMHPSAKPVVHPPQKVLLVLKTAHSRKS